MNILAIIPARGGSKGVHRKNLKNINGKPLISYTIEAAQKSKYVNRLVVSTDDIEIAQISKKYGAEIPCLRPELLAGDISPTVDAVFHMINYLKESEGYIPSHIMLLQCTSPLRNFNHINEAVEKLKNSSQKALISVCESEINPYWTNVFEGDELKPFIKDGYKITRRQDLPKVYRVNGAIYLIETELLLREKTFQPSSLTGYIMDEYHSIDIDTELDFKIAELVMKELIDNEGK
ncbi:cytidylyltransferase domain-containing protein [Clostridium sp. HCS.1]|uniref:acylneuraminate cytidylyltransferase family protein n=1 Tax=Clostridium sp. HCS.1 TaxID=3238594 RepID=UPI003A0FE98F